MDDECFHGIFKTHVVPYDLMTTNLFNLNINKPHTDWDRSRILDLDYRILSWMIFLSLCEIDYEGLENL